MHYQLTFNGVIVGESGCFRGSYFAWVMHNALISRDKSALFSGIGHICEITRQVVAERKVSTPLRSLGQRNLYHTSKLFILLHNVFNRDFVACNPTFCLTTKQDEPNGRFFQRIVTRVIHSTRCRWFWIWSDVLRLPYLKGSVQSFTLFLIIIIITLTIIIIIIIIVIIIIIITTVNITLIIIINTIINIVESFTLFLIIFIIIIILC